MKGLGARQSWLLWGLSWGSGCLPWCFVPGPGFSLPDLVSPSPPTPSPGSCPSADQVVSSVAKQCPPGPCPSALGPNVSFAPAFANSRCLLKALQHLGPQSPKIRVEPWFLSPWRPSQAPGGFLATLGPAGVRDPPSLSYWLLPALPLPMSLTPHSPPPSAAALVLRSLRKY